MHYLVRLTFIQSSVHCVRIWLSSANDHEMIRDIWTTNVNCETWTIDATMDTAWLREGTLHHRTRKQMRRLWTDSSWTWWRSKQEYHNVQEHVKTRYLGPKGLWCNRHERILVKPLRFMNRSSFSTMERWEVQTQHHALKPTSFCESILHGWPGAVCALTETKATVIEI